MIQGRAGLAGGGRTFNLIPGSIVAIETEVKIRIYDWGRLKTALSALNARRLSDRHFEDNFVLDFPGGNLRSGSCLLRVRKADTEESVTFKGPPRPAGPFKSREEIETGVANAEAMLLIFEQLGLKTWFRYQKFREEFEVSLPGDPARQVEVALDSTPIGDYAELEGQEEAIREVGSRLGLSESQFLRDSYYTLFERYCRARGEIPGHMVFR